MLLGSDLARQCVDKDTEETLGDVPLLIAFEVSHSEADTKYTALSEAPKSSKWWRENKKLGTVVAVLIVSCPLLIPLFLFLLGDHSSGGDDICKCSTLLSPENLCTVPTILLSFDAFRHDFVNFSLPSASIVYPHLSFLANRLHVEWMEPVFPSKTFPNHWSLVTGLVAESHGIIANHFFDPEHNATFSTSDTHNSFWWGGEPIWLTAMRQGLKVGAMFWPGSETPGQQPTYFHHYDGSVSNEARVDQVLSWLDWGNKERPDLVLAYFSLIDTVAHATGPWSPQTAEAVKTADSIVGRLLQGLKDRGILECVNVVLVSDHGMAQVDAAHDPGARLVFLDAYLDLKRVRVTDWTPVLQLWPPFGLPSTELDSWASEVVTNLSAPVGPEQLTVWRKGDIPERFCYRNNPRVPPVVALAKLHWTVTASTQPPLTGHGAHGYDNTLPEMGALLLARGPSFKTHTLNEMWRNVNLYPLLCRVLDVNPSPNNGSLDAVQSFIV